MSKTARQLVTSALTTSGAISAIETPTANEINHGLTELNNLMEQMDLDSLFPYTSSKLTFDSIAGVNEYTIGLPTGNALDISRIECDVENVVRILTSPTPHGLSAGDVIYLQGSANVVDGKYTVVTTPQNTEFRIDYTTGLFSEDPSSAVYYDEGIPDIITNTIPNRLTSCAYSTGIDYIPLKEVSIEEFYNTHQNDTSFGVFAYDYDYPNGLIKLPSSSSTTIQLRYQYKQIEYSLDDTIDLPSGYFGAIQYKLAEVLCVHYGIDPSLVTPIARQRYARIKRLNQANTKKLRNDFKGGRGRYNPLTDTWSNQ